MKGLFEFYVSYCGWKVNIQNLYKYYIVRIIGIVFEYTVVYNKFYSVSYLEQ